MRWDEVGEMRCLGMGTGRGRGVLPQMGLAPSTCECTRRVPPRASAYWVDVRGQRGEGLCRAGWEEMDARRWMRGVHLLGIVPYEVRSERRSVKVGWGMASEGSPGGTRCAAASA